MTAPNPSMRDEREILEERARALARPVAALSAGTGESNAIVFTLSRERYAVPARNVFAVFRLAKLVRLPGAEPPVVGVTQWRGDVLTLLDIRSLVGSSVNALDDLAVVLVLGIDHPDFGILADVVGDPIHIGSADILPLASGRAAAGAGPNVIKGVTRDAHLILDADALVRRQTDAAISSDSSTLTLSQTKS